MSIKLILPILEPMLGKVVNTLDEMDKKNGVQGSQWTIRREYDQEGNRRAVLCFMHEEPILDPVTKEPLLNEHGNPRIRIVATRDENGNVMKYSISELVNLLTGGSAEDDD